VRTCPGAGTVGGAEDGQETARDEHGGSRRPERVERLATPGDADEEAAQDLVLGRSVLVQPVVVVALRHEAVRVDVDDPVHHDRVERRTAVGDDVTDGVRAGGTQDRHVTGMEAGLHADAVRGDVRGAAAQRGGPQKPDSRQQQRDKGADAGGSRNSCHG
jgi:hypothetical protein